MAEHFAGVVAAKDLASLIDRVDIEGTCFWLEALILKEARTTLACMGCQSTLKTHPDRQ